MDPASSKELAVSARLERRTNLRKRAKRAITVVVKDQPHIKIEGLLLDVSPDGFRFAHCSPELRSGQEITVTYSRGEVRARIIWTKNIAERREAGCMLDQQAGQQAEQQTEEDAWGSNSSISAPWRK